MIRSFLDRYHKTSQESDRSKCGSHHSPRSFTIFTANKQSGAAAGDINPATAVSSFYNTVENDPDRWLTVTDDFFGFSPDWVAAVGRKEGFVARYSCWLTPEMWNEQTVWFLTSVSLDVSVLRTLGGEKLERGVMTAETAFEPFPYLDEVASLLPDSLPDGKLIGKSFEWLD